MPFAPLLIDSARKAISNLQANLLTKKLDLATQRYHEAIRSTGQQQLSFTGLTEEQNELLNNAIPLISAS